MKLAYGDTGVNLSITLLSNLFYISYCYLQIQYIDTINVPFCILQQLLKLMATNLNASMASAYKILPHTNKYPWCGLNNWLHVPHRRCSTEQFEVWNLWSVKPVIQNTPGIFVMVR